MKFKNLIFITISSIFFVGCSNYNLEPKYNNDKSKLIIDEGLEFKIKYINFDKKPQKIERGSFTRNSKNILLDSKVCPKIIYQLMTSGQSSYITNDNETDLRDLVNKRKGLTCIVEKINNLKFFECTQQRGLDNAKRRYTFRSISNSTQNAHGFDRVERMKVDSKCFEHIKQHYYEKAKKDDIKIERYIF